MDNTHEKKLVVDSLIAKLNLEMRGISRVLLLTKIDSEFQNPDLENSLQYAQQALQYSEEITYDKGMLFQQIYSVAFIQIVRSKSSQTKGKKHINPLRLI